jgi:hypothetical protein
VFSGPPGTVWIELYSLQVSSEIGCNSAAIPFSLLDDGGANILGYRVRLTTIHEIVEFEISAANKTVLTLHKLRGDTAHQIEMKARNKYGYGPYSDAYVFQTAKCQSKFFT